MSRLGKKPVHMPEKVKAEFNNGVLGITGPGGKLLQVIDNKINIKIDKDSILVEALGESREHNMLHGLTRGLVVNMIEGVTSGFKKELEAIGLGYKVSIEGGKKLVLSVGFSHLVNLNIPSTVKVTAALTPDKNTLITITGIDKYEVGAFAAKIRAVKPPEPYKGFGIRYLGEKIIRKAGKAAAGSGKK
ncbi:50S ribosomal protein L6 [Candidatus Endomicrobiellum devescovinae]|uniref:50S ribosomal protein L6 n=1 Tax=Candidatus Endomicrobiellum devescovinae TaxID=3242322 RepID=UPI00281E21AB|nr:50S ribosomal protein L6 [Endomicrobium sp.]MDR2817854.1 50S ribosomal protein L6 [Endomicrobium sp.]